MNRQKTDWRKEPARGVLCAGWRYAKTISRAKDRKSSDAVLKMAAERGDAWAQYFLGLYAETADGEAQKNEKQAVYWFRMSAKLGNPFAQFALGLMYLQGRGVRRSERYAAAWFRRSSAQIGWGTAELQQLQQKTNPDSDHCRS